jgi:hypothetical protein
MCELDGEHLGLLVLAPYQYQLSSSVHDEHVHYILGCKPGYVSSCTGRTKGRLLMDPARHVRHYVCLY